MPFKGCAPFQSAPHPAWKRRALRDSFSGTENRGINKIYIANGNKSTMSQSSADGVVLTQAEVAQSKANKKKMGYTISQLPVFRNAVQILSFTIELTARSPRSLRKFTDSTIDMANELMRHIGLAQEYRANDRIVCIIEAISIVYVLKAHFGVYCSRGIISKDAHNKAKKVCENTVSQLSGWRDFVQRKGLGSQSN